MFIDTWFCESRTPAGSALAHRRRLTRHIAPRWGAARHGPRIYKPGAPSGVPTQTQRAHATSPAAPLPRRALAGLCAPARRPPP